MEPEQGNVMVNQKPTVQNKPPKVNDDKESDLEPGYKDDNEEYEYLNYFFSLYNLLPRFRKMRSVLTIPPGKRSNSSITLLSGLEGPHMTVYYESPENWSTLSLISENI
ncbi:hypothetical protein LSTR_LSTR013050 [Laodelphax striatellus]|uniref:Uncharacterized protein n=1 Tax=Laodelphax striatellus TaxID=195883 RepID=A0A482XCN9_LAOST|nr:hypothetical protein LSTR_LSTR013050 [Laodelphax striatellus]